MERLSKSRRFPVRRFICVPLWMPAKIIAGCSIALIIVISFLVEKAMPCSLATGKARVWAYIPIMCRARKASAILIDCHILWSNSVLAATFRFTLYPHRYARI